VKTGDHVYLVTGGGGFIGSHLVRALVRRGERVRVLDNGFSGSRQRMADVLAGVEWREGDVRDVAAVREACRGVEVVFHLAAVASVPRSIAEPEMTHATNLTGTLNVLVAAQQAGVRRVVYASSSAVYGDLPGSPKRETMPLQPLSPYAAHKLAGEHYCRLWHELHGLETVALRYFNVFGPGQDPNSEYAAVIPKFITTLLAGAQPTIYGDGQQVRDFIYVENVVDANLRAATAPGAAGQVLNVGSGVATTILHLVDELRQVLGRPIEPVFAAPRPGDIFESVAEVSRLRAVLDFEPAVGLGEGLRRTVQAFAASLVPR
jgi:nucleoside-diphosphate-sugar epimerase